MLLRLLKVTAQWILKSVKYFSMCAISKRDVPIFYDKQPNASLKCCKITRSLYILLKKVDFSTSLNHFIQKKSPIKMDNFFPDI